MKPVRALLFAVVLLSGCQTDEAEPAPTHYALEYRLTGNHGWYNVTYCNHTGGTTSDFIITEGKQWSVKVDAKSGDPFFMSANCGCSNADFAVEVYANGNLLQKSVNTASSGGNLDVVVSGKLK